MRKGTKKDTKKKELMDIYFENATRTEKLNIKVFRTVSKYAKERRNYQIVVNRYPTDVIRYGTLLYKVYDVNGNVLEELIKVIKKHAYASGMNLEFYWIDSDLQHRAKIFLTPVDMFEENLEKLAEYL